MAHKMRNLSIKWKIFLAFIGFSAALLVFLWFFQVVFLKDFYEGIKINEIEKSAAAIVKALNNSNSEDVDELMLDISYSYQICTEVVTPDMETKYFSHAPVECTLHKMTVSEKLYTYNITKNQGGKLLTYIKNEPMWRKDHKRIEQSIVYSQIINTSDGELMVMLNTVISPVNATVNTLRTQFYYIIALMILFSIILALIIAKRVSKPIEKVNEGAKSLAKGDYSIEFNGSGYKEIAELSDTLNIAAKELSKVEQLRKDLIANVSHDLRTPLTLIEGYAEAMRDLPEENNKENAQIIIDEANRLTTLVNDVLNMGKLQSGAEVMNKEKYNLTKSIDEVIQRLNALLKKDGYEIIFEYEKAVYINADESKIAQAFYNLLINAVNYSGEDKSIYVYQKVDENSVTIEIKDTGEGISEENLPYIWERYYKVDKVHKRAVTGSGLGLFIVKSVIELHNGTCGVVSKVDKGSVFWFKLDI